MQDDFALDSYNYDLPQKNIAQFPSARRDESKLLVLNRNSSSIQHKRFSEITSYFNAGDVLVINDTKVFPARLHGRKTTGGKIEIFLLELPAEQPVQMNTSNYRSVESFALIKSSKRPAIGSPIHVTEDLRCIIIEYFEFGKAKMVLEYPKNKNILEILQSCGSVPLPPYIERKSGTTAHDSERYQTIYADKTGAVAAPTAGLHFTAEILEELSLKGVEIATLTLHVGFGTFAPVRATDISNHQIHSEYIELTSKSAEKINQIKQAGGKVWAVGTTAVRTLEFCATSNALVEPTSGWCDLYIIPGFKFAIIDNLITNFHLPKSSLLFLVSALCGKSTLLACYREAIAQDYRFYSYGDAMAIIT